MWNLAIPILTGIATTTLGFSLAWTAQTWRYSAQISEIQAQQAHQTALMAQQTQQAQRQIDSNYQEAFHEAAQREQALRVELNHLRTTSNRLRTQTDTAANRLNSATRATAIDYATTANTVFSECQRAITELAAKADGHANDVRHHRRAWPGGGATGLNEEQ